MRAMRPLPALWMFLSLLLCNLAGGAAADVSRMPGYVDINRLPNTEEVGTSIEVFLRKPLLNMVAMAVRQEDREFAELLDRLHLIQARIFENIGSDALGPAVSAITRGLDSQWERVVRVRENDERIDLFLKFDGEAIAGLYVAIEEGRGNEVVLVNIVGDIDPAELGRIGAKFNIEPLENLGLSQGLDALDEIDKNRNDGTSAAPGH